MFVRSHLYWFQFKSRCLFIFRTFITFSAVTTVINQESLADGDRRCAESIILSDADVTSCVQSPDVRIPSCSMTYQLNNNVYRANQLIVMVYGQNLMKGLRNVGVKPIAALNPTRNLLSNPKYTDMPWKSCKKCEKGVDHTETFYLDQANKEMMSFLCSYSFQSENYINIAFLFNPIPNLNITLCEVKVYIRV